MKTTTLTLTLSLILALVVAGPFYVMHRADAQATATNLLLTATSLSAAVTQSTTVFPVASATGITAQTTLLYVEDGTGGNSEAVFVNAVNGTQISVTRGYNGTQARAHLSGSVVLAGPPYYFVSVDPSGSCTASASVTPTVNIQSKRQWICSSITNSWVPGFFNEAKPAGVTFAVAAVSGGAAVNPSGPLFHVTGTSGYSITAWGSSTSLGSLGGGGSATQPYGAPFCTIPDATWVTTATNNIALASTAVVNKKLCFTFDGTNKKYIPSY